MDDLEFNSRAHSNPYDSSREFLDALSDRTDRQQLLDELRALDDQLRHLSSSLSIPPDLRMKLLSPPKPSWFRRSAYALAASLVMAIGLTISTMGYRPSADEIAMHDAMIAHLYHEEPRYRDATPISWSEVEPVLAEAGIHLSMLDGSTPLIITFANLCRFGNSQRAVHLVTVGEHGPVSVLLVRSSPVGGEIPVEDQRFKGSIKPVSQGNMAVIGEKNEQLEKFETLISNTVQWSI
jgi:hypothetical protein